MNSTLGSVLPLAMFYIISNYDNEDEKTLTGQPVDEHHDKREDKNYKIVKKDKK